MVGWSAWIGGHLRYKMSPDNWGSLTTPILELFPGRDPDGCTPSTRDNGPLEGGPVKMVARER